ncbi:MAG: hypothetical protein NTW64_00760, partial [Candidatus Omnitrophica bacterium]|nr:hypothetical protein [Candidatus Omnitrophota bacterium]
SSKKVLLASILIFSVIISLFFINRHKNISLNSEISLVLLSEAAKINFHFDPARKETYAIDLNSLNLTGYKALSFSVKKTDYNDNLHLRVEFINSLKEKSELYVKDIPHKWRDYKINLMEFQKITDWSKMSKLAFIVEEWNVGEKKGVVYIDEIKLIK